MKSILRHGFTALRILIGFALLWYLSHSGVIDWKSLWGLASAWQVTLVAIAVLLVDVVVTAWRLCVLLHPLGFHLTVAASTRLSLIGLFFNSCLPGATGGDLIKIYYAAEGNRGRRTEVGTIILLDRAAGMFALVLYPLLAAPFFRPLISSSTVLQALLWGCVMVIGAMLAGWFAFVYTPIKDTAFVRWFYEHLPMGKYLEKVVETTCAYRHHEGAVVASILISLLAHTLSTSIIMLCAHATNGVGAAWAQTMLVPLGFLANTLPTTPGGLGVGEAAFNSLFLIAGIPGGAAAMLGWRVLTVLVSLFGLVYYLQGRQRFVHDAEEMK